MRLTTSDIRRWMFAEQVQNFFLTKCIHTFWTTISFEEVLVCKIESNPLPFHLEHEKSDCKTSVAVEKGWFNYHICMGVVLADYCFIGADSILISSLCKKRGRKKNVCILCSRFSSELCLSLSKHYFCSSAFFAGFRHNICALRLLLLHTLRQVADFSHLNNKAGN